MRINDVFMRIKKKTKKLALAGFIGAFGSLAVGCSSVGNYLANRGRDLAEVVNFSVGMPKVDALQIGPIGASLEATDLLWLTIGSHTENYELGLYNGKLVCRKIRNPVVRYGLIGNQLETLGEKTSGVPEEWEAMPEELKERYWGSKDRWKGFEEIPWKFMLATDVRETSDFFEVPDEARKLELILQIQNEAKRAHADKDYGFVVPYFESLSYVSNLEKRENIERLIRVNPEAKNSALVTERTYYFGSPHIAKKAIFHFPIDKYLRIGEQPGIHMFFRGGLRLYDKEIVDCKEKRNPVNFLDVNADISAIILRAKIGISPGQLLDFGTGLFGLDIAGDDKQYWKKHDLSQHEREYKRN